MYCRFCGNQIDDDSIFCARCGKNLTESNKEYKNEQNIPSKNEFAKTTEGSSRWGLWLLLPALVILLGVIIAVASSSNGSETKNGSGIKNVSEILSRDLNSDDYTYTSSQGLTSYRITIIPKRDIDNCDIQLTLYNSKGEKLYSDTISKTNLKEGSSYTYTFDFGFVNSLSGSEIKWSVTGKCKYFTY